MLSLKFKEELVEVEKADGEKATLAVREMNGRDRESWLNSLTKMGAFKKGGTSDTVAENVRDWTGSTSNLLARTLYWKAEDGSYTKLTDKEILEFPSTAITELTSIASRVNGLSNESAEDAEKN